jgi:acetolactate synthase-1/2/3 large subunit
MIPRTGARILVDQLQIHGADRVFCVPGESYLSVLDALSDRNDIQTVVCRQEGGMAIMAEADGKLTGRPGICMVTRGPGATNATAGLHIAVQDSSPLIMFVGQIARGHREREAFQELDYRRMFGQLAKWTAEIDTADRIPEFVARAFRTATSGRPGPVVLALPEDMLDETAAVPDAPPYAPAESYPAPTQLDELRRLLAASERPLVLLGGARWDEAAWAALQRWAEANDLPVAAVFRRQDRFDNEHRCYVGDVGIGLNPALKKAVDAADLLVAIGARLDDMTTGGYTLLGIPAPKQRLVHVHADPVELGRVFQPTLAINASPRGFGAMIETMATLPKPSWGKWRTELRAAYEAWQKPVNPPGALNMSAVVRSLRERLPDDAVFTNGAGNFATWLHRFNRFRRLGTQAAPTSGSMGYGFPSAIAAKLRFPDRPVIAFTGDGDFMMTGQELATAVQFGANVVVLVIDNGMYGTIRMHQEREFPGRVHATELRNPDFAALARAYGAFAERVERTEEFMPAFERALAAGKPALLHLKLDPEAITPRQSLSEIRTAALAKR